MISGERDDISGDSLLKQNFLDTSEYPEEHTFYAFSSSTHPNEAVMTAIQEISEQGSRTIFQTVTRLLRIIASALHLIEAQDGNTTDGSANDMDDGSDDDQALLDSDNEGFGIPTKTRASSLNLPAIQQYVSQVNSGSCM
jgi:hypothetical protein